MVCNDYPGLFPFLTSDKIMAIPVIGTFLGPAGIRVRGRRFPRLNLCQAHNLPACLRCLSPRPNRLFSCTQPALPCHRTYMSSGASGRDSYPLPFATAKSNSSKEARKLEVLCCQLFLEVYCLCCDDRLFAGKYNRYEIGEGLS